jgi:hypothetical protein
MALILRIDVDKPFGRSNLFSKLLSKISEEFYFPISEKYGYLNDLNILLDFLETNSIPAHIYFRNCTVPSLRTIDKLRNHKIGFHAENTRTVTTFNSELDAFKSKLPYLTISSFTKHGSGNFKLGKHHFPKYEPQKYLLWAKELNIEYLFGNGLWCNKNSANESYWENMYWVNKSYRTEGQPSLKDVVQMAKSQNIVILIHPSNYIADGQVQNDFQNIVEISKQVFVQWITL